MLARIWRNWNPCALLVGRYNSAAIMENSMVVPQKNEKQSFSVTQQFQS